MKRTTNLVVLLLLVWLSLGFTSEVASQPQAVVRVAPSQVTLNPGESTVIEIWVDDVVGLYGFEFELHFDPVKISARSLALGSFLVPGLTIRDYIDNDNGIIRYDMTQWGQDVVSKTGSGVLLSFDITLLEGTAGSSLTIASVLLTDRDSFEIPCEVEHAVVSTPGLVPESSVFLPLILR
jgi:hypothetical protein